MTKLNEFLMKAVHGFQQGIREPPREDVLKAIEAAIGQTLEKLDNENKQWVDEGDFSEEMKKVMVKALNAFEKALEDFFIAQKKAIVKKVKSCISKDVKDAVEIVADVIEKFLAETDEDYIERLAELFDTFTNPVISNVAQIACSEVSSIDKIIESLSERMTDWLKDHRIKFAREVQETTHKAVIQTITNSQSIDDAVTALMELPEFDWRRARTTARTETISAANAGTLEGWRQSQVVKGKKWCCAGGPRSRDTHKKADGQVKALDEPFLVGAYKMMHPGDGSLGAGPEEVCNCRCTMLSVLEEI